MKVLIITKELDSKQDEDRHEEIIRVYRDTKKKKKEAIEFLTKQRKMNRGYRFFMSNWELWE